MNPNLWNDQTTASDSTDRESDQTGAQTAEAGEWTQSGGDVSPLTAAIEASQWNRADIELVLQLAQVALLLVWLVHTYTDD